MFVKIKGSYINLSMVTGVYSSDEGITIYYINKNTLDKKISLDEFIKEVGKQSKNVINQAIILDQVPTINDRFKMMDFDE